MITRYQLVIIGSGNKLKDVIVTTFKKRVQELGLEDDSILILDESNFNDYFKRNAPAVALYFGDENGNFSNMDILNTLSKGSTFILPIVNDLEKVSIQIPEQLHPINAFELKTDADVESLIGSVLESLSLLRLSRRLFISYKRNESRSVAIQLFEKLEEAGFDVFLDTHSVRPGEPFQDELWHRLVDTDVVVLLNTPGFLESEWTTKELAKASALSIGLLQLIWPTHTPEKASELSSLFYLNENDFENKHYNDVKDHLENGAIKRIISEVESLRARSLAARQDNLIAEFIASAKALGKAAYLQPEKFITIDRKDGKEVVVIPTVGVPHAFTYNQSEELINRIRAHKSPKAFLLYDHRNIREKWLNHLAWLDGYLPINSIKITEVEAWLKKL